MPNTSRRTALGAVAGAAAAQLMQAQTRDYSQPSTYPDPDIVTLDRRFSRYVLFNTPIQRLWTGSLWAEGPAWNGVGRFLVWSDIPNDVQYRWIADDNRVTVFRKPAGYSNGNTFDGQGRQLSCEHGGRRVVRYEHDGSVSVIAERFEGKRLNSPNDVAVHRDGSIWFTDPTYGIGGNYEGFQAESETKTAVYRVNTEGRIDKVTDEVTQPNGICFSPDQTKVYVADTGAGETKVWDVDGRSVKNGKRFVQINFAANPGGIAPGRSSADGIRCDVDGNVWMGARPGVVVVAPDGVVLGAIKLPETCANIEFGGPRRNRLFMVASQSLYAVYVGVRGA